MKIERFEDIEAWQLARALTRKVYSLTRKPGFAKDYGLKSQIQDASGSSMHNIAEAYEQAGRTRAAIRGFINYLKRYENRKVTNPEP
jgi:four helix bundle protein